MGLIDRLLGREEVLPPPTAATIRIALEDDGVQFADPIPTSFIESPQYLSIYGALVPGSTVEGFAEDLANIDPRLDAQLSYDPGSLLPGSPNLSFDPTSPEGIDAFLACGTYAASEELTEAQATACSEAIAAAVQAEADRALAAGELDDDEEEDEQAGGFTALVPALFGLGLVFAVTR